MPTQAEVPGIVAEVRQRLEDVAKQGIHLQVAGEKLEDDWLYVVVTPSRPGVRALDDADTMSRIERELQQNGKCHVLLVPTLDRSAGFGV
jgi:hypothetical protein